MDFSFDFLGLKTWDATYSREPSHSASERDLGRLSISVPVSTHVWLDRFSRKM